MRRLFLIVALRHKFIVPSELPKNSKDQITNRLKHIFKLMVDDSEAHHPSSVEEHYLIIYFEALDVIISVIENRFDQPCFKAFLKLESILLKSITGEDFSGINVDVYMQPYILLCFFNISLCTL